MSFFHSSLFNRVIVPFSFTCSVVGGGILIQSSYAGKKCPSNDRIGDKVVVITGSSSGIGKETARELAKRGGTIIMACRHANRCEEAARSIRMSTRNKHCVCKLLDLASLESIKKFVDEELAEIPRVDILINNAGVLKPRPPKTTEATDDGIERQFGVNFLGHFYLTNLLLPKLQQSKNPRIINVSAPIDAIKKGKIDLQDINKLNNRDLEADEKLTELYYQSKLATLLFTNELSKRLEDNKICVNSVNPGVTSTNIGRYSKPPFYNPGAIILKPMQKLMMKSPQQGAQTSIYLATAIKLKDKSGYFFEDCTELFKTSDKCDAELSKNLWDTSEDIINNIQQNK